MGVHPVKGRVGGLLGAADAPDLLGAHGLGAAGKLRADVAGTQHRDGAANDGAHGHHRPPALGIGMAQIGVGVAQQHQRDHDEMLGDGDAVGTGGVAQDHLRRGVQGVSQIGVHAGKAAAEPLHAGEGLQVAGLGHPVHHLIGAGQLRRHLAVGVVVHRKAAACGGAVDERVVGRLQIICENGNFFHLYTSSIFSAQRIPSAAADRIPPA